MKHTAGQTDTQQFCYDDLSRLTWSGTNGTPPCSGTGITAGTLTAAQYQQSNSYNVDGGLTSGPAGNYTYGDSTHPHAVTTTSSGYSAAYDAAGNLICRATSNAATCSGSSVTGQQLSYDAEGRLTGWQDQPTSPTQTVSYLYDGSGNRVAMQSTANGTTTLTSYIGSIEEVQTSGSTTQTTTFYSVGGKRIAANVNGTFYYFGYDALGSQVAVLDANGNLAGAQLYGPYGSSRYHAGTIPTSIGFTGQRADSVTGLDYYNARYYDPTVGQFLSADRVQGNMQGMDPYAYVGGNPESRTDPTGQRVVECAPGEDCGGSGSSSGTDQSSGGGGSGSGGSSGGGIDFQPPRQDNGGDTGGGGTTKPTPTPTPNNPTKQKIQDDGHNDTCSMSASRCNQAEKNRADQNQQFQDAIGNVQIALGVFGLVLDLLHIIKDFSGGWSFDSITRLVGDAISVIGDLATVFASIASRFNLGWLSPIADMIGAIASGVGAVYRAATGSLLGMGVIVTTFYTLKAAFIEGDIGAEAESAMASVAEDITHFDVFAAGFSFATSIAQSYVDTKQYQIDTNNNKPLNDFCPC